MPLVANGREPDLVIQVMTRHFVNHDSGDDMKWWLSNQYFFLYAISSLMLNAIFQSSYGQNFRS